MEFFATSKVIKKARKVRVEWVRQTNRRLIGIAYGKTAHTCWISKGGEHYCSCIGYQKTPYLCSHLACLISLFTEHEVKEVKI